MGLSKTNQMLIETYNAGYRVVDEVIYKQNGKIIKGCVNHRGYRCFHAKKHGVKLMVHKFVAFQKFGFKLFESGIEVRHIDGNSLNNKDDNIMIGTHSENMMDIPEEARIRSSINASNKTRKFTDEEMRRIRVDHSNTRSYKDVMSLWGISSKGTLHHILNNKYVTTKK